MSKLKFDNREVEIKKYEDLDMVVITVQSLHNSDQRLSFTLRGKNQVEKFIKELRNE